MKGWLVNDTLTCIPGTKTFWHDLLEWFPDLQDKTNSYTDFSILASQTEKEISLFGKPDYIIRNATFFRSIEAEGLKTISLIQDFFEGPIRLEQLKVANKSDIVVFNSESLKKRYERDIAPWVKIKTIPLGVDFDFFSPVEDKIQLLPDSILYVGDSTNYPKGFDRIMNLINTTSFNFCLVMKDDFNFIHDRVTIFNKIDHSLLRKVYNSCSLLVCSSREETLHLAGVEAAACGLPIVATDVGVYKGMSSGPWGEKVKDLDFESSIRKVMQSKYNPREFFLNMKLDKESCKKEWRELIYER